jgi:hypothetical protein
MKYLSTIISIVILFSNLTTQAQKSCSDSTEIYGLQSTLPQAFYKRLRLSNGEYIIYNIREKNVYKNYESDYIVKTDSAGNYKQGYNIKIENNSFQLLYFAVAAPDGGFVLVGDRHDYNSITHQQPFQHLVALRFDATMNLQWKKEFIPKSDPNYDTSAQFTITAVSFNPNNALFLSVIFSSFNNSKPINEDYGFVGGGVNFFFA